MRGRNASGAVDAQPGKLRKPVTGSGEGDHRFLTVATFRCFGVRRLAAAFPQASLLAVLRVMDSTQRGGTRASSRGTKRRQAAALQSERDRAEVSWGAYFSFDGRLNVTSRSSRIPINEPAAKAACLP